jgi:hypothetical protein
VGPGQQSVADPSRYLEPYPADSPDGNPDDGYSDDSSLSYPDGYPAADPEDEQVGLALGLTDHEALTERRNTIRRQRRQTWTFLAMFGSVLLLGVAGYTFWTGLWSIGDGTVTGAVACPVPTSTVAPIKGISLTVLNGTTRRGLAGDVARGLQARKFAIIATGNDNTTKPGKETAVIRHGPAGVLKAKTVAAQVAGKVLMVNDKREDESVDLILQPAFKQLNDVKTATRLTAPPPVASPDGCVPVA